MASDALKQYAIFIDAFVELLELFPFSHGGYPSKEENASIGVHLLNKTKDAETGGVKCLETLHNFMKNYYAEKWVN
ncbi:hypothetical protein AWM68_02305 [Fictibacillus phosphorivorans]|uniref:Uncharacterized protein n=1 Tax=Fictibacillus phosphorivorans TaxID=1221500 RepID=A0A163SHQ5_9BACL|nr:hypothetical protein [Fictibacillus phosphorivorans]KZE69119.1 hypothetical protein AWM68_02305 [Fictibacillus phosphorivorans]